MYQTGAPLSGPEQRTEHEARAENGGAGRDRTDYLLAAGQALSQVSYGPRDGAAGWPAAPAADRRTNKEVSVG